MLKGRGILGGGDENVLKLWQWITQVCGYTINTELCILYGQVVRHDFNIKTKTKQQPQHTPHTVMMKPVAPAASPPPQLPALSAPCVSLT